jgi:DNA-directed RNA polymerase beta' subunit/DNA-directed RNA polymerase subunit K/omega
MATGNPRFAVLNVTQIGFSLLSRAEITRRAVCDVTVKELNIAARTGDAGTLYDRRMGPISDLEPCGTCKKTLKDCPGHFGRIKLALPMPHAEFGKDYTYLLSAFCNCKVPDEDSPPGEKRWRLCLSPLVTHETADRYANLPEGKKWRRIVATPGKLCSIYGEAHKAQATWVYYTDRDTRAGPNPFRMILRRKDQKDELLNPARLQAWIAKHVKESWIAMIGLEKLSKNKAEQMIIDSLLVLGNIFRLPTTGEGAQQSTIHHDLSQIYSKIVEKNEELKTLLRTAGVNGYEPDEERLDPYYLDAKVSATYVELCALVSRLFNNKDNGCRDKHATKAPKGITEDMDGKGGLVREHIFGGRSGNTARTVCVAGPGLDLDEVGVPGEIMDHLVISDVVTEYNIDKVKALARQGKVKAVKGGPARERRGDTCIDTGSAIHLPADVVRLRVAIEQYSKENEGSEPNASQLMRMLNITPEGDEEGFSPQQREALDALQREDLRLREEQDTRSTRVASCIDSIAPGDTIERTLLDGDIIIISRQPILRKNSTMAHRVKRVPGKAMQVSDGAGQPYNLDHDGDEMNLYVPQGVYAQTEALKLMHFSRNILSEQSNKPLVGLIQDALLSAYLLTSTISVVSQETQRVVVGGVEMERPKVTRKVVDVVSKIKRTVWDDCVEAAGRTEMIPSHRERCARLGIDPESGRGLFSILFREDFVYTGRSPDKTPLIVRGGVCTEGTLSQSSLNTGANSIHHEIILRYGATEAIRFLSSAKRLLHRWLQSYGFTLGYKDLALSESARADIERVRDGLIDEVKRTARAGASSKGALAQHVEADVLRGANNIIDQLSAILVGHLNPTNNFMAQVYSGSKGTVTSITQMDGLVGQITIQQERPANTLSDRRRTDLHFTEDDPNPEARGLCTTSYVRGLRPSAMIFQGMATHQAAFDISVGVGDTGYAQRKLVMYMLSLRSLPNGSVVNADGSIIQFRYGGDGLNPSRVLNVGGKARFINFESVVDAVKLEVALARVKGVTLPGPVRHFLTAFEETKVIAKRAIALQMGARPYGKVGPDTPISAVLQANAEFEEGLIPDITIFRRLASGENAEIVLQRALATDSEVRNGLS